MEPELQLLAGLISRGRLTPITHQFYPVDIEIAPHVEILVYASETVDQQVLLQPKPGMQLVVITKRRLSCRLPFTCARSMTSRRLHSTAIFSECSSVTACMLQVTAAGRVMIRAI